MFVESRASIKLVGVKAAEEFLAMNNFPGQRKYSSEKGQEYADNMASGEHRRIDIAVADVKKTGVSYLMNGQHNCNAILLYGKPVSAIVSYYDCETMEDAWRLFSTFDTHSTRTESQFMKSRRGMFEDKRLHEVQEQTLNLCGSALYLLGESGTEPSFGCEYSRRKKTIKADMVNEHPDEVMFMSQFSTCRHMARYAVVTAVLSTWRANPKAAQEFWSSVATGAMLPIDDPRKQLGDFLRGDKRKKPTKMCGKNNNSNKELYSACILYWNTWRVGGVRKAIRFNGGKLPAVSL